MKIIDTVVAASQKTRSRYLRSIFAFLTKLKINAGHITFFRALAGPVFVLILLRYPIQAVVMLLMAGLLDLIDGGLARYQKTASDRGKFWDVLVDHLNYVLPIFGLMFLNKFSNIAIAYHLVVVPVLYLLAVVYDSEALPTDWIIHPYYRIIYFKFLSSVVFILYFIFNVDVVDQYLLIINIIMTLFVLYYVCALERRWKRN